MINNQQFYFPEGHDEKQFIHQLADQFIIKKEPTVTGNLEFFDTFDWRLFNKSLVLYASGDNLSLRKLYKTDIIHSTRINNPPVFIEDFPDGDLKEQLAPIIKMRALIKLIKIQSSSTLYRILNSDEKTVARLIFEKFWPNPADPDRRSMFSHRSVLPDRTGLQL